MTMVVGYDSIMENLDCSRSIHRKRIPLASYERVVKVGLHPGTAAVAMSNLKDQMDSSFQSVQIRSLHLESMLWLGLIAQESTDPVDTHKSDIPSVQLNDGGRLIRCFFIDSTWNNSFSGRVIIFKEETIPQ